MTTTSLAHFAAVAAAAVAVAVASACAGGAYAAARQAVLAGMRHCDARFPWTTWVDGKSIWLVHALVGGAMSAGLALLLLAALPLVIAAGIAGVLVGLRIAQARERGLATRFAEQIPDTSHRLADAVRAGASLPEALASARDDSPEPVRTVLTSVTVAYELGHGVTAALRDALERTASREFAIVCEALALCLERGGPLPTVLDRIALSVRELQRLRAKIHSGTSGAVLAMKVMALTPAVVLAFLWSADPRSVEQMFRVPAGMAIVIVAAALIFVATRWSRSILRQYV
jgi:tight adherence protein B